MPHIEKTSVIKAPADKLFEFFLDPNNLQRISPTGSKVIEVKSPVPLTAGAEFSLKVREGWLRVAWQGRVCELERPKLIVDEQVRGPFRRFRHTHKFRDIDGATLVIDVVEYKPPCGPLGMLFDACFIHHRLKQMFDYRHQRLKELFETGF